MIVPMKKVWIAATDADRQRVLEEVARLGVVHIQTQATVAEGLESTRERLRRAEQALRLLEEYAPKKSSPSSRDWEDKDVDAVLEIQQEKTGLIQQLAQLTKSLDDLAFWGEWEPRVLEGFKDSGYHPRLYRFRAVKNLKLPERSMIWKSQADQLYVLVLQNDDTVLSEAEPLSFPRQGRRELTEQRQHLVSRMQELERNLCEKARAISGLRSFHGWLQWRVEWEASLASAVQTDDLVFWSGYVPETEWPRLRQAAVQKGWGIASRDPGPEDAVPTLVKNPIVPGMVKPVFDLLGTIPGYRERDISLPFLAYFIVFFAIIIGDAGYGLIFLLFGLSMLVSTLVKNGKIGEGGLLLTVLSAATVVWGSLTGTWFGNLIDLADGGLRDFLRSLTRPPFVNADYTTNMAFVKFFCFSLGLTQLALGHVWNFFRTLLRDRNPLKSIAELGALTSTLALYPLVLTLVLPAAEVALLPAQIVNWNKGTVWALWPDNLMNNLLAAAAGVGLVVLFGKQEGNFLKGIGDGLSNILNTALGSVGWFSDNISYIRLFAVGLAGFAIAQSFNTMAQGAMSGLASAGGSQVLGLAAASLILLLGHGLNLIMALLGVVVHGVRLNLLEFSGRLGIEWSGFAFKPLQLWQQKKQ